MPYNTKALKTDVSGVKPAPQHFNPVIDEYEPQYGRNNASRVELYGPDGEPIKNTDGKLDIRASEIETQLTTIQGYIDGIEGTLATLATAAGQSTIAGYIDQVETQLSAIQGYVDGLEGAIGTAVASPAANTLLARLKSLEDKIDAITAGTTPAVTQLSGSNMELFGVNIDDRPAANTVSVGATFMIVGTDSIWQSNGTDWVVM